MGWFAKSYCLEDLMLLYLPNDGILPQTNQELVIKHDKPSWTTAIPPLTTLWSFNIAIENGPVEIVEFTH